jgi:hypothetical protein
MKSIGIFSIVSIMVLSSCSFSGNRKPTQDFYIVESLYTGFINNIEHDGVTNFEFYSIGDTVIVNTYYDFENSFGGGPRIIGFNSDSMIPKNTNMISFSDSSYFDSYERFVIRDYKRTELKSED